MNGMVKGEVDFFGLLPDSGATVEAVGTSFKTTVGDHGKYSLSLPPGKYTIRAFDKYNDSRSKQVTVAAGKITPCGFELGVPSRNTED